MHCSLASHIGKDLRGWKELRILEEVVRGERQGEPSPD
jgi:hypothetical protein